MPLYTFKCQSCDKEEDHIVSSSTQETKCGACGGTAARMLSVPGNYYISGANSASTRPKNGLNRRKGK